MSRSSPHTTELPFRAPLSAPKPIPRVNIAKAPPEGYRWLAAGEVFDSWDSTTDHPKEPIGENMVGNRVTKECEGIFIRPLVLPRSAFFFELSKKRKTKK